MTTVFAPQINVNDDQVGVVAWHVEDGDYVEAGVDLVDLETSKAVVTITADVAGRMRRIAKAGAIVRVGTPICRIGEGLDDAPVIVAVPAPTPGSASAPNLPPPASPSVTGDFAVSRLSRPAREAIAAMPMREQDFAGAGLVTAKSLLPREKAAAPASPSLLTAMRNQPLPVAAPGAPRREAISLGKRAEIEMLSTGESGLINSTVSVYLDAGPLRDRLQREGKFDGNVQPILLYELSRLLKKWPQFTAYFDNNEINYYDRIDIGVAIDLGRGLKVVTIRHADRMMPIGLHEAVLDFGLRYMENRIQPHELGGSTITVTDLSGLDVLHFKPLINGRQSAILGVGGDATQPGQPMSLNLTFDHRATNGRDAALFLGDLRARLLSYAPAGAGRSSWHAAGDAPPSRKPGKLHCHRCHVENGSYQDNKDALMFACFDADGTPIALCYACISGW